MRLKSLHFPPFPDFVTISFRYITFVKFPWNSQNPFRLFKSRDVSKIAIRLFDTNDTLPLITKELNKKYVNHHSQIYSNYCWNRGSPLWPSLSYIRNTSSCIRLYMYSMHMFTVRECPFCTVKAWLMQQTLEICFNH